MSHAAGHPGGSWTVAVVVAVGLLGALGAAAACLRARTGRRWPPARAAAAAGGAVALATGLSPLVGWPDGSGARAHMAQHVLLGMVAPLGLVLGAPLTLALAVLPVPVRRRVTAVLRTGPVRVLTHPATTAGLHVGGLVALYTTPLYALASARPAVHALVQMHLVLAGCLFVWSLAGPERAARGPGPGWRLGVLIMASGAHGYLAKLLFVRAGALPPGSEHDVADLRAAARWMYYAGDAVELALAAMIVGAWYRRAGRGATVRARRSPQARVGTG